MKKENIKEIMSKFGVFLEENFEYFESAMFEIDTILERIREGDGFGTEGQLDPRNIKKKKKAPIRKFESKSDEFSDFTLELEDHEGKKIMIDGHVFKIDNINDFIRDYTYNTFSDLDFEELIANHLLIKQ